MVFSYVIRGKPRLVGVTLSLRWSMLPMYLLQAQRHPRLPGVEGRVKKRGVNAVYWKRLGHCRTQSTCKQSMHCQPQHASQHSPPSQNQHHFHLQLLLQALQCTTHRKQFRLPRHDRPSKSTRQSQSQLWQDPPFHLQVWWKQNQRLHKQCPLVLPQWQSPQSQKHWSQSQLCLPTAQWPPLRGQLEPATPPVTMRTQHHRHPQSLATPRSLKLNPQGMTASTMPNVSFPNSN